MATPLTLDFNILLMLDVISECSPLRKNNILWHLKFKAFLFEDWYETERNGFWRKLSLLEIFFCDFFRFLGNTIDSKKNAGVCHSYVYFFFFSPSSSLSSSHEQEGTKITEERKKESSLKTSCCEVIK